MWDEEEMEYLNYWVEVGRSISRREKGNAMTEKKIYVYSCFGDTLEFAESLGWVDNHPSGKEWEKLDCADEVETECLDFIRGKGWVVIEEEHGEAGDDA